MPIVSFINQKGGVGKTTGVVHLRHWLRSRGHSVLLVDADAQRSSTEWLDPDADAEDVVTTTDADEIAQHLPALRDRFDYVVCDAPAGLSEATRAILICSDLAIVPVQPTGADLRSSAAAIALIREAQQARESDRPRGVMYLSRAVGGTRLKNEAIDALSHIEDIPLLSTVIHQRQAVADASGQSCTAWDMARNAAAPEFDALFAEAMQHVG